MSLDRNGQPPLAVLSILLFVKIAGNRCAKAFLVICVRLSDKIPKENLGDKTGKTSYKSLIDNKYNSLFLCV